MPVITSPASSTTAPNSTYRRRPSRSRCGRAAARDHAARVAPGPPPATTSSPNGASSAFRVRLRGAVTVQHVAGAVPRLWGEGRGGTVGHGQAHPDARLHAVLGALGAQAVVEGGGAKLPYQWRRSARPSSMSCSGNWSTARSDRSAPSAWTKSSRVAATRT